MLLLNGNWKLQVIVIEIKLIIGWFWLRHVMKFNQKNSHTASWTRRRRRDVNRREQGRQEDWRIERRAHRLSWWATVSAAVIDAAVLHNKTKHLCAATGNQSHYGWPLHGHGPKLGLRGLAWQQRLRLRQHLRAGMIDAWCRPTLRQHVAWVLFNNHTDENATDTNSSCEHWAHHFDCAGSTWPDGPCSALGEAFRKGASRSGPSRRLEGTQELLPNRLHRRQAKSISGQTMGRCQTLAVLGINRCLNETEVDNTQGGSRKLLALQGELQKCRPDLVELSQSDMRLSVSRRIWNQRSRRAEGGSDSHVTRAGHMVRSRRTRKPSHRAQWPAFRSRSLNAFTEGKGIPWGEEDEGGNWERERE